MKARMERLETRSAFRSSGILPPRRPPAAPLSPGEPRRRFLGVGGPLLPWIGRREGDEGARGAPFLPPSPRAELAGAAARRAEEGGRRRFVAGPAVSSRAAGAGFPARLRAVPPGWLNRRRREGPP